MTERNRAAKLVVLEAQHIQSRLVVFDISTKRAHFRFVSNRNVTINKTPIQFHVLPRRQVGRLRFVQTPRRLHEPERIPVRRVQRNVEQRVREMISQFADRAPVVVTVLGRPMLIDNNRRTELE